MDSPILLIVVVTVAAHLLVRVLRGGAEHLMTSGGPGRNAFRAHPKLASLLTILVSAATFTIYFLAVGLILRDLGLDFGTYLTTASVIGLAVGFGSQGLVQDVVTGLTLIFSGVLDVGDVVDIAGQTGRVESVGLRFTELVNLHDQRVFVPNRNIVHIARYRKGYVRAYVDVQMPGDDDGTAVAIVRKMALGMQAQHGRVLLAPPELSPVRDAAPGGWRYVRVKFRLWPGQGQLLVDGFRPRLVDAMRRVAPDYAEWMVTVTYRAE